MFEELIAHIHELSPVWIYCILFFFSFIENVFPPSPSDFVVILGAAVLAQISYVNFVPILVITSLGSSTGFMLMYYIGKLLGEKIIRSGKLKFITPDSVTKTDKWFSKYGYKLIVLNRFLPGTRSVISFFSGFSELLVWRTFILATISAFLWNAVIIYIGFLLGYNAKLIDKYLSTYSDIVLIVTIIFVIGIAIRYFVIKSRTKKK
jgi:membrane protein DedA with SNARE-associated domain